MYIFNFITILLSPIRMRDLPWSYLLVYQCKDWPLSWYYTIRCPRQLPLLKHTKACQSCHHSPLYMSQHSLNMPPLDDIPQMPLDLVKAAARWQVNMSSRFSCAVESDFFIALYSSVIWHRRKVEEGGDFTCNQRFFYTQNNLIFNPF